MFTQVIETARPTGMISWGLSKSFWYYLIYHIRKPNLL